MCGRTTATDTVNVQVLACEAIEDLDTVTVLVYNVTRPGASGPQPNITIERIAPWPYGVSLAGGAQTLIARGGEAN